VLLPVAARAPELKKPSELPFSTAMGSPWARLKASTYTKPRGVQSGSALRLADSDDVRPWYRWRGWSVCTPNQVRGWQREKAVRRQRNWRGYMMPEGIETWFVRSARPLHSLERASRHALWENPRPASDAAVHLVREADRHGRTNRGHASPQPGRSSLVSRSVSTPSFCLQTHTGTAH
jgi:hypothetical protein